MACVVLVHSDTPICFGPFADVQSAERHCRNMEKVATINRVRLMDMYEIVELEAPRLVTLVMAFKDKIALEPLEGVEQ